MKLLKVLLWIVLVIVVVIITLFISAWLSGFGSVTEMLNFIWNRIQSGELTGALLLNR